MTCKSFVVKKVGVQAIGNLYDKALRSAFICLLVGRLHQDIPKKKLDF